MTALLNGVAIYQHHWRWPACTTCSEKLFQPAGDRNREGCEKPQSTLTLVVAWWWRATRKINASRIVISMHR